MESARQIVSVAAVLGLLLAAAYLLRRHAGSAAGFRFGPRRTRTIEVIERVALTPQHSLHVVRLAGELVLFSAGPGGVRMVVRNLPAPNAGEPSVRTPA